MKSVEQYNSLEGKMVWRGDLRKLINLARQEGQRHIENKLRRVLQEHPDQKRFEITKLRKVKPRLGKKKAASEEKKADPEILNGIDGSCQDLLHGLECLSPEAEEGLIDSPGLGKPVSSEDVYQTINRYILEAIKAKGDLPWHKPWKSIKAHGTSAANYVSKKAYRGINSLLLNVIYPEIRKKQWKIPYFLTFKQIEDAGGKIKKGSRAYQVVYFTTIYSYRNQDEKLNFSTGDKRKFVQWLKDNKVKIRLLNGPSAISIDDLVFNCTIPFLKYYNVFNADDITGIKWKLPENPKKEFEPIETAELVITAWDDIPPIRHGGDSAHYSPGLDYIQMPEKEAFDRSQDYYGTLFHEMTHSTGHKKRLDRDLSGKFGSSKYAFEELIGELGASFLNAETGILYHNINATASYLKGWSKKLVNNLEKDNKFFFRASSRAQAAADMILQPDPDGVPRYLREDLERKSKISKALQAKREPKKGSRQLSLADEGLKGPVEDIRNLVSKAKEKVNAGKQVVEELKKLPAELRDLVKPIKDAGAMVTRETFKIPGEIGTFLGPIEKKPVGSVVMTLDAPPGTGKTRLFFQMMNAAAAGKNRCLFASLEEHADSGLFTEKRDQYIKPANTGYIDTVSEAPGGVSFLQKFIPYYDIIFIDSAQKLGWFDVEEDLRKKFNGKLFVIIYQRNQDGSMKGGSAAQFDADLVCRFEKGDRFRDNYAYWAKNRYQEDQGVQYNIYSQKTMAPDPEPDKGSNK